MKREPNKPARRPLAGVSAAGKNEASRSVRVAAQLRQEVARLVALDLADPRLEGLVIGSAWISNDLRLAKVFFRIATTSEGVELEARRKEAEKALERASGRLRKAVTARLALRVAPELRFVYDEGQDARDRIEQLLDEVKRESSRGDGG
ncbi:MAG: 30S ribosome-binding factor RbfA [Labilithrix sp.]|nr:30S ribosome-binding factor RbfA [Labilithrix sp.]